MKLNFCPECAAPLRKRDGTQYACIHGHLFWNNPRATADVVLVDDRRQILVSKRAFEPNKGDYDLPGGFLEYGENQLQGAVREIQEETGIRLKPADLEPIFTCGTQYEENVTVATTVFLAKQWHGTITAADDSEALEWQPLSFFDSPKFSNCYDGLREILEGKI